MSIATTVRAGRTPGPDASPSSRPEPAGPAARPRCGNPRRSGHRRVAGATAVAAVAAITLRTDGRVPFQVGGDRARPTRDARGSGHGTGPPMSDSSSSGKFAGTPRRARRRAPRLPDEWPATRAEPAPQDEIDEWQATRVQARQPNGIRANGSSPPAPSACATPPESQRAPAASAPPGRPTPWASTRAQYRARDAAARATRSDYLAAEQGRDRPPDRRQRARAVRLVRSGARRCSSSSSTCSPNFIAVHDIATLVVAQASRPASPRRAGARCRSS